MRLLSGAKEDYIRKDQLVALLNNEANNLARLVSQEKSGKMGTPEDVLGRSMRRLANDIQALES
jgi:hypothetical protein